MDNITALTLRIGATDAGAITVSAALTPSSITNLSLLSDAGLTQTATVTVSGLRIDVDDAVTMTQANVVTTLAANVSTSGQSFSFSESSALVVGTVDGTVGVTTSGGTITISTTTGTFTVTDNIAAGAAAVNLTAGADDQLFDNNAAITGNAATVTAADMALEGGTVNVGSGIVTLIPDSTDVDAIDLGNGTEDSADTLELSDAELDTITALTLRIGATDAGAITVTSTMTPANITNLSLLSDAGLSQSATITVSGLRIDVDDAVAMTQANVVTTLAANVSTSGQSFTFNESNTLVVGTVDGTVGVTSNGGTITVTTANGTMTVSSAVAAGSGTVNLTAQTANQLIDNNAAISGGAANLTADDMALEGGTVNVGSGIVTLDSNLAGIAIDLGDPTDSTTATLELSDTELDTITATTLRIGATDAGAFTVTASLTPANITNLSLLSTAGVTQETGDTITVSGLRIDVDDAVTLTQANNVTTLSAVLSVSDQAFSFTDADTLQIGTVDGTAGVTTNKGAIAVIVSTGDLTVANNVNSGVGTVALTTSQNEKKITINTGVTVTGTGTGGVSLTADKMSIVGSITATGRIVTLKPSIAGEAINLGSGTDIATNTLELSDGELDNITATTLRIGATDAGAISVSSALTPANITNLSLLSDAGVSQSGSATITVAGLRIDVDDAVTLTEANNVTTLAANVSTSGQTFSFTDSNALTVGTVDGTVGVTTSGGTITISTTTGTFTVTNNVAAGAAAVNLSIGGDDQLLDNNAAITGNAAILTADDMALEGGTVNVGSGVVTLKPDSADVDAIDLGNGTEDTDDALELSDTELDTITALTLRIGATDAGAITVSSAMTPANITNLSLLSDAGLSQSATITVSGLRIDVDDAVTMTQANVITTLAANASTSGQAFTFNESNVLTIGTVDGTVGVTANGGTITVTTANGTMTVSSAVAAGSGTVNLIAQTANQLIDNNGVISGAVVNLKADDMALAGGTINAGASGMVTLISNNSGNAVDLGDTTDSTPATLELSDGELDTITALTLRIGADASNSISGGAISVTAAISPANATNLSLASTTTLSQSASATVTVTGLRIQTTGNVTMNVASNNVTTLAGNITGTGTFSFKDANTLIIGEVDTTQGLTTNNKTIQVDVTTGNLTVNNNSSGSADEVAAGSAAITLNANGNEASTQIASNARVQSTGNITIISDKLDLQGTIGKSGSAAAIVILAPETTLDADAIDLGSTTDVATNTLELSNAELDRITAATLRVGSTTSGAITVTANGVGPDLVTAAFTLITDLGVGTDGATGTITYTNVTGGLKIDADTNVSLNNANNVKVLAAVVADSGQTFTFKDSGSTVGTELSIGTVDGTDGVSTNNGAIVITVTGTGASNLVVTNTSATNDIDSGTSTVALTASGLAAFIETKADSNIKGDGGVTLTSDNQLLSGTINGTGANIVTLLP
ncbi:MAG: S-layer family protein, partial [Nitrospinaceae bacterium]|nr:S-layer family protein [Nitrospinaceae bacterium]